MSKLKIRLIALGLLVAGVFAWIVTTQGPLAAIKVTLGKASNGTLTNGVFGVGTLEARHSYNLAPTLTSRVSRILVDQGDRVRAGQLLAEMDAVDLNDRVTSSQQAAERSLYAIRVAEAQLAEANSRALTASAAYTRFADLRAGGYVSQEMLDAKLHEKNAALSAVASASAALSSAQLDQVRTRADADGVGKLRAQTRLLSPVAGIVTARLAEPGVTVVAGQSIIQVIDPASLWIRTRIEQKQVGLVRVGQTAEIVLRSQPNTVLPGRVIRVEQIGDAITEERIVNVEFAASAAGAMVGELAEVTIKLPQLEHALSIPAAALKQLDKQEGVWVMQDGRVQFKPVKSGLSTLEGRTQIISGLAEGEEVIVYSQQELRAGMKVKVVAEIVKAKP
ncbi:MAG TPA: efflux RND transporter periplasmic adaptor subunit [Gallionellaceae bacterium]|nr:efflux RND transporter periplasmic adaptor subunit [Gallionellaceae bacterium]